MRHAVAGPLRGAASLRAVPPAVLVAYSGGLVERRGTDIDTQIELLRDIVTGACDPARDAGADEIASEIVSSLVPEPGCAEDDVCLLVVRRQAG